MKCCSSCKQELSLDNFGKSKNQSDGYGIYCRECRRKQERQRYQKNKEFYKQKVYKSKVRRRKIIREKIGQYLSQNPCVDCGEKDIVVLDFDHLENKNFNISVGINNAYGWEKIKKEIDKCEVVCSNCHRRRTASRRDNYWRLSW